jgi:hypothetical protein
VRSGIIIADDRNGSKSEVTPRYDEGRFTPETGHRRTNRQVDLVAFMHSEFKRAPTDPMPVICYLQRHSIRPGRDTSVVGH